MSAPPNHHASSYPARLHETPSVTVCLSSGPTFRMWSEPNDLLSVTVHLIHLYEHG